MSKLRVGIISANWGVYAHLPAWRSLDDVEVVGICTSRAETALTAANAHNIPLAFHDFREMANDSRIDIVDCGTRPPLRHAMVLSALAAKKHVYNGIPFAKSVTDARDMVQAARESGTVAAVDAFMQAVPALVYLKELVESGSIGSIYGTRIFFDAPLFTQQQTNVPGYLWFADPANGASALRNLGSHMVNLLIYLFGPIEKVCADQSLNLREWQTELGSIYPRVNDTANMLIRFDSGLPGQLHACWSMSGGPGFRLEVWGSGGRLVAAAPVFPQAHDTQLFIDHSHTLGESNLRPVPIPERLKCVPGSYAHADRPQQGLLPMAAIFVSMVDAIRKGGNSAPSFDQAFHAHMTIEAAEQSYTLQRWVSVEDA